MVPQVEAGDVRPDVLSSDMCDPQAEFGFSSLGRPGGGAGVIFRLGGHSR